jgi:hypothetical protein
MSIGLVFVVVDAYCSCRYTVRRELLSVSCDRYVRPRDTHRWFSTHRRWSGRTVVVDDKAQRRASIISISNRGWRRRVKWKMKELNELHYPLLTKYR